jgi:hypothetical protein
MPDGGPSWAEGGTIRNGRDTAGHKAAATGITGIPAQGIRHRRREPAGHRLGRGGIKSWFATGDQGEGEGGGQMKRASGAQVCQGHQATS